MARHPHFQHRTAAERLGARAAELAEISKTQQTQISPRSADAALACQVEQLSSEVRQLRAELDQRQEAERSLRESNQRMRNILGSMSDHLLVLDRERKIAFINYTVSDLNDSDVVGTSVFDYVDASYYPAMEEAYRIAFDEGESTHYEVAYQPAEGEKMYFLSRVSPCQGDEPPSEVVVVVTDSTERERFYESLRLTRETVDRLSDAVFSFRVEGTLTYANDAACRTLEYTRAELLGLNVQDIAPDFRECEQTSDWDATETPGSSTFESHLRTRSGACVPVEVTLNYANLPIDGEWHGFAFVRNVAERNRARQQLWESEQRFDLLLRSLDDIVWSSTPEGKMQYVNPAVEKIYGRTPDDFLQNPDIWMEAVDPRDRPIVERSQAHLMEQQFAEAEYRVRRPDGSIVWVHDRKRIVHDENGMPKRVCGIMTNISAMKQAEETLRGTNRVLAAIHEVESRFISDAPTCDVFDALLAALLSLSDSECGFIGEVFHDEKNRPYLKTYAARGIPGNAETPEFQDQNAPPAPEFVNVDLLCKQVLATGEIVFANQHESDIGSGTRRPAHPPFDTFLGIPLYSQDKLLGIAAIANRPRGYDGALTDHLKPFIAVCASLLRAYQSERCRRTAEEELHRAHGQLEARVEERTAQLTCLNLELREEIQQRKTIERERSRLATVVEATTDFVGTADLAGRVRYVNNAIRTAVGLPRDVELAHLTFADFHPDWTIALLREEALPTVAREGVWTGEIAWLGPDGREIPTSMVLLGHRAEDGRIETLSTICREISREKEIAELLSRIAHVDRVSLMGEMVASIAHEINQPLGIIANNAQAGLRGLRDGSLDREDLLEAIQDIAAESLRAGKIIQGIGRFLTKTPPNRAWVDINSVIQDVVRLTSTAARRAGTALELELDERVPEVWADGVQMQQVLFNLVRNALEAVADADVTQKRIVIESRGMRDTVRVRVSDTGVGIPPDQLSSVFEPYFTTKPEGLGMGLSISRSIVNWHGGHLSATPRSGGGMVFELGIPIRH